MQYFKVLQISTKHFAKHQYEYANYGVDVFARFQFFVQKMTSSLLGFKNAIHSF